PSAVAGWVAPIVRWLVLDTNIVLDLFLFADANAAPLRADLEHGRVRWVATSAMREELVRVLAYRHIESRLAHYELLAGDVLACFDHLAHIVEPADRAKV